MTIITVHVAKTQLSKLIARAEAGEEIVIARGEKPAVKLVAVSAANEPNWFEHAPGDYINKDDIATFYRKYPHEWNEILQRVGFAEDKQVPLDLSGLREAVEGGKEFTIMRDGKPLAKLVPVEEKKPRVPGRFAHLRGNLPPNLFDEPLSEDELQAWEGKYSGTAGP